MKKTRKFPQHVNDGSAYILLAISFNGNLDLKKKNPQFFKTGDKMTTCGFKTFSVLKISLRSTFTLITVSYHKGTRYTLGKSLITSLTNGGVTSLITIKSLQQI